MISRSVAICTNGTRVLGLGNIGPVASMPVMEGKAVFYDQFVGISAMPILIDATDVDTFVDTVLRIAPTFGGIHLEDISAPECFEIERRLIEALPQPVMHDDVHGTAVVSLAAAMVACRYAGIELRSATVGQLGLGAAGFGIASLMVDAGVRRVLAFDPLEASHARAREHGVEITSMERVMAEADVVVATTGRAGLIQPEMIRAGQVILALTNPDPEIEPEQAEARRRRVRRRRSQRQQRARLPRDLPRRAPVGCRRDQRRDEARGRRRRSPRSRRTASSSPTRSTSASTMRSPRRSRTRPSAAGSPGRSGRTPASEGPRPVAGGAGSSGARWRETG